MTLRFPTLFDALPRATSPREATITHWRIRRAIALVAALLVGLGALAGCDSPHAYLDGETEPLRPAEAVVHPVSDTQAATPVHHETVNPGSGVLRMPFALQGYGG